MTIISPARNRSYWKPLSALFAIFIAAGIVYIFEYNLSVDAKYEIKELKQEIVKMQEQNADLKSKHYTMTDPARLEKLVSEFGLIIDRQPKYLGSAQ